MSVKTSPTQMFTFAHFKTFYFNPTPADFFKERFNGKDFNETITCI